MIHYPGAPPGNEKGNDGLWTPLPADINISNIFIINNDLIRIYTVYFELCL